MGSGAAGSSACVKVPLKEPPTYEHVWPTPGGASGVGEGAGGGR